MIGPMVGDVVGSIREWHPIKSVKFDLFTAESRFTDDSVLHAATMYSILNKVSYLESYKKFGKKYFNRGYGKNFKKWVISESNDPYGSWGNGSGMRVCSIGLAFNNIEDVLAEAKKSAEVTHNHEEGIKGAQAVALAVYLAKKKQTKEQIRNQIEKRFDYNLSRKIIDIRKFYKFDVSCQGSIPESIISFLESENFEEAIRIAISLGGDADTQATIAGGIAEAFYKKAPTSLVVQTAMILPKEFVEISNQFYKRFIK